MTQIGHVQAKMADDAERAAKTLMTEALKTGRWFHLPEQLAKLRAVIQRPDERQERMKFG